MVKDILMTDAEADVLIQLLKKVIEPINGSLKYGDSGCIDIYSDNDLLFYLDYKYEKRKKVFNFRETYYNNFSLIRINIGSGFHKNADGEKVEGNRVNIFSEEEYYLKGDGKTHMRSFKLPFDAISDSSDFLVQLEAILSYTHTNPLNINLNIQGDLFN